MDKSLLVGINDYVGCPLAGCLNDIQDVAALLCSQYKFDKNSIRLLTDARATSQAIIDRLYWLVDGLSAGDRVLFYYSGHGAKVAGRGGSGKVDRLHDVICAVDFSFDSQLQLNDDLFHGIFSKIPAGVRFDWVSDSCHSGLLAKDLTRKWHKSKCVKPPLDMAWRHDTADELGIQTKSIAASTLARPALNLGFIAGCKDKQTSADATFSGRPNGALTYYLLKNLKKDAALPIKKLVEHVHADLKKEHYTQIPQADGLRVDAPFLG